MTKPKRYYLQMKGRDEPDTKWHRVPFREQMSLSEVRGFLWCMGSFYPSNDTRVLEHETDKVTVTQPGRGRVHAGRDWWGDARSLISSMSVALYDGIGAERLRSKAEQFLEDTKDS